LVAQALVAIVLNGAFGATARGEDPVPKTVEGGSSKVNRGGKEIADGFRHMGRGIKKVFTGQRSKEDFKKTTRIGKGFKDLGLGVAGVGRGVGRKVRDGVSEDDSEYYEREDDDREYRRRDYSEPEYRDDEEYGAQAEPDEPYLQEEPLPE
jgi:hypothetical protein